VDVEGIRAEAQDGVLTVAMRKVLEMIPQTTVLRQRFATCAQLWSLNVFAWCFPGLAPWHALLVAS
jgi:hypothetical protein